MPTRQDVESKFDLFWLTDNEIEKAIKWIDETLSAVNLPPGLKSCIIELVGRIGSNCYAQGGLDGIEMYKEQNNAI